jgi:hypothetical protein
LNSQNAIISNDDYNEYLFDIPDLIAHQQNHIYINIDTAVIPVSWYNINEYNNYLEIESLTNDKTYSFYIEKGNYNCNTLATYLTDAVSNYTSTDFFYALFNFNVSYNSKTTKFTFTNNYSFRFSSNSTILEVLGFITSTNTNESVLTTDNKLSLTSTNVINLIPHKYLYVILPQINTNNLTTEDVNFTSILCAIPIDTSTKGVIVYKNNNDYFVNTEKFDLRYLKIKIVNEKFQHINLNGMNFSMTFNINIINFVM